MKVCIDVQPAVAQRAGVGRYTRLLVENLDRLGPGHDFNVFYFDFQRNAQPPALSPERARVIRWCPGRVAQLAWKTLGAPAFDRLAGAADVFHFPNFTIPPLRRGRSVVTIHDMSYSRFPEYSEEGNLRYLQARMPDTVNRADAIITVSHFSAAEVCSVLHADPARVHAVHNGISADFVRPPDDRISTMRKELGLERPYLLTVGTLEPRKNLPFLIDLFERLPTFDGDLVLAGMQGWKCEPIMARIRSSSRVARIRHVEYVPDRLLPALYAGAELFVLTSFYEGFGFPPLEAMACGTPVLSSSRGSLGEVLGEGAALMDDFDPDNWVDQVTRLLSDTGRRQALVRAGRIQAGRYTWENTARKTWAVYKSLAGQPGELTLK